MKRTPESILLQLLVLNSQRGDQKAFNLLVKRWNPRLIRQAYRLTGDQEASQDIAQESWQGIVKGLKKLKDPALFPAWALRIVTRRAADWIRKLQKDRKATASGVAATIDDNEAQHKEEQLNLLSKALHNLPAEQRVILELFYLEKQSVRTIADILSLNPGTVKSRLFYAREHLKKIYKQIER